MKYSTRLRGLAVGGLAVNMSDCEVIGPGSIPGQSMFPWQGTLPPTASRRCLVEDTGDF